MNPHQTNDSTGTTDPFKKTQWTLIELAQRGTGTAALDALNTLCTNYWYPIYAFIRRTCGQHEEAQDLTQGYFADLLKRGYLADADRKHGGKFRAFLLADVKQYLGNQHRRATAKKRGGGAEHIPIRGEWANERYGHEPVDHVTPDQTFDRQWALTLLNRVMEALQREYEAKQRQEIFEALKQFISWNAGEESYADAARRLGKDENYVKVNVFRMRKRYRELLEAEVGQVVPAEEVANEIRLLAASIC
jgi:RNA polymerase sigma-70 factor (ECF subfamily)